MPSLLPHITDGQKDHGEISFFTKKKKIIAGIAVAATVVLSLTFTLVNRKVSSKSESDPNNRKKSKWRGPNDRDVAWIAAFPGSGQMYIMHLIQLSSGRSTATNYGHTTMKLDGSLEAAVDNSVPIYRTYPSLPDDRGPVYLTKELPKPDKYVATLTHGSGYCLFCEPKEYFYTNFPRLASKGSKMENGRYVDIRYECESVDRMVQVIRDPFDNIVVRFYSYIELVSKRNPYIKKKYPPNKHGFQKWCQHQDDRFEEMDLNWIKPEDRDLAMKIPCRQEFIKYARFHSNAYLVSVRENKERLVVKYEDYATNLKSTVHRVNDFIRYHTVKDDMLWEGESGIWTYEDYYTMTDKQNIASFLKRNIHREVWVHVRKYTPYFFLQKDARRKRNHGMI